MKILDELKKKKKAKQLLEETIQELRNVKTLTGDERIDKLVDTMIKLAENLISLLE